MWLLVIFLGIICVGLVIWIIAACCYYHSHLSQYEALTHDLKLLETTKDKLTDQVSTLRASIQNLTIDQAQLTGALDSGRRELESLVAQKATYELDGCLIEQMASKRGSEEELLKDVEMRLKEAASQLDALRVQCVTQTEQLDAAKSELVDAQKQKEQFLKELEKVQFELDVAKNAWRTVLEIGDAEKFRMELTNREKKLIEVLDEIKEMYPEFKGDIAGIEWNKVWLPKAKVLCMNVGCWDEKKTGIYKITLVSDPKICYVGQSRDIKERWYEHIKKMVGKDPSGGEKLYDDIRPDEVEWEILEECSPNHLNEREEYWIQYFGCREIGLNKK